ncbi:MAG: hypothetical protein VKJ27_00335 [Synechocystis sp.]|nr:hypothetical protein [Synechocystis sp.]
MTELLEKAFHQAQQLSDTLQDEIAQQLLFDMENELKWQEALVNVTDTEFDILKQMADAALIEDHENNTEQKGFREDE